jgi:hypothetical protein
MDQVIPFSELSAADLVVDAVYSGGSAGHAGDDPLAVLLPVGNQGGFRYAGSPKKAAVKLVALYSSGTDPDWPDHLDLIAGSYTYYGDNKSPGRDLHDTPRQGNAILRSTFAAAHGDAAMRATVAPFLLFESAGVGRSIRFRGLLVPGSPAVRGDEDLVAVWRSRGGARFQNYRAIFTVLDTRTISRAWLADALAGTPGTANAPVSWSAWVETGVPRPLLALPTVSHRSRSQQLPSDEAGVELLSELHAYFAPAPVAFERCAAALWRMAAPAVSRVDVTRASRDGGRDAVGAYAIGPAEDPVQLEFALEAKCFGPGNSVGVREMSRLISRLKHRQFGVMVTTSFVNNQAYREVRDDAHPVVILAGADVVRLLRSRNYGTPAALLAWLKTDFPLPL